MKTYRFILFVFCLGMTNMVFGQQSPIYQKVQQAKQAGNSFEIAQDVLMLNNQSFKVLDQFRNPEEVSILDYDYDKVKDVTKSMTLVIPHKQEAVTLELVEVDESFYNYAIVTSFGDDLKPEPNRKNKHFRGVVKGKKNSLVAISFFEDHLMGIVSTSEGDYNIAKLEKADQIVFYKELNLIEKPRFGCATNDDRFKGYSQEILNPNPATESALTDCVRLYFETEFDMYLYFGSIYGVEQYVTALYNQVAVLYGNESINTQLSAMFVWCCPDPYTAWDTGCLLEQFQHQTNAIPGDLGQLLTFRNVGGGRAAGFNGICNRDVDESLAVSGVTPYFATVPTYSWTVEVVTHEFGHLFGSRHTHACVWNGNNTAIDGCSGFTEGGCPLPGSPSGGGTIMSYCHFSVGINFNLGFGPQPGNVIRNVVANAACLSPCTSHPPLVDLSHDCCNAIYYCGVGSGSNKANKTKKTVKKRAKKTEKIDYRHLSLNVSPNPTTGAMRLKVEVPKSTELRIKVYNMSGQIIFEKTTYALKGNFIQEVQLPTNIPEGIYIVDINDGAKSANQRVVVLK